MFKRLRHHHISFTNAVNGILWAFTTQPNFLIHFSLSAIALWAGIYLQISRLEMIVIVFTVILGLTAEMINTSIEAMTDLITRQYHQDAKIAKDVSAGMMLITAIGSVIVAAYIFIPQLTG